MKPRKILVVDDSKMMRRMYEVMLRQYPLVYAGDGPEAFERLREHWDIELVVLDINMPSMNSLEFLQAVRRDMPEPPAIVVVTTEGREEDTSRALEAGAAAYIRKPFQNEEILYVIAHLEEKPRRE